MISKIRKRLTWSVAVTSLALCATTKLARLAGQSRNEHQERTEILMNSQSKKRLVLGVAVVSLSLLASTINALGGWGCWRCEYADHGQTEPSGWECIQVGNNQYGDGIYCREINIADIHNCAVSGGPCYNIEVW